MMTGLFHFKNQKDLGVYMSDCVNETPDCVEKSRICLRIIFDLKNSHTLEKIMGRIKHFSNF